MWRGLARLLLNRAVMEARLSAVPAPVIFLLVLLVSLLVSVPVFPATYVVDPAGDDANAGDAGTPWRTIKHAASSVAAGDTVIVHAGTYRESVSVSRSGAAGSPISFVADPGAVLVSPNPSASCEAFNILDGVSFITLQGIEATGGFDETIFVRPGAHDISIEGCNLHHNRAGVIVSNAYNIVVQGCALHDNVRVGVRIAGSAHDVTVVDTDSFLNGNRNTCDSNVDGFAVTPLAQNITFQRTRAYQNGGDGYDFKGDQVIADGVESFENTCSGMKVWQGATVQNSLIYGNARGISTTSMTGGSAVTIRNCTIAQNDGVGVDLTASMTADTSYAVDLVNNIVAGDFKALQYVRSVSLSESYNILFRSTLYDPVIHKLRVAWYSDHKVNLGTWTSRTGQGQGTLAVDPLFVDPANADFHVLPTSAAVGRGADLGGGMVNIGMFPFPAGPTNHAPFADPGRNRVSYVGRLVRFNGSGSVDPDGDLMSYWWDLGDGSAPVAACAVSHAYAAPGTYTVTLTVSDGSLSGSNSARVVIR